MSETPNRERGVSRRFEMWLVRKGAAGIVEHEEMRMDLSCGEARAAFIEQLDTLGPLDRVTLTVDRLA